MDYRLTTLEGRSEGRGPLVSALAHGMALAAVLGVFHFRHATAKYKLPGTSIGVRTLTYYSAGSPARADAVMVVPATVRAPPPLPIVQKLTAPPTPVGVKAAAADKGTGNSSQSGQGEGKINIALQKVFPYPRPNLAGLPHGTHGDVILNAVIDAQGNITELTLLQGLGPVVDDAVIATVKGWSYTPATRDGVAVQSEQELHFHYDKS